MPRCKKEEAEAIYRNLEASQRLCFGQLAALAEMPRGRGNSRRDKIFRFPNILRTVHSIEGIPS